MPALALPLLWRSSRRSRSRDRRRSRSRSREKVVVERAPVYEIERVRPEDRAPVAPIMPTMPMMPTMPGESRPPSRHSGRERNQWQCERARRQRFGRQTAPASLEGILPWWHGRHRPAVHPR